MGIGLFKDKEKKPLKNETICDECDDYNNKTVGNHMEKILGGNSQMESEVAVEFSCIKIFMALRHLENLPGNGNQEVIRLPTEIIQTIAYLCYSTYSGFLFS
jgi:hypothetical protein